MDDYVVFCCLFLGLVFVLVVRFNLFVSFINLFWVWLILMSWIGLIWLMFFFICEVICLGICCISLLMSFLLVLVKVIRIILGFVCFSSRVNVWLLSCDSLWNFVILVVVFLLFLFCDVGELCFDGFKWFGDLLVECIVLWFVKFFIWIELMVEMIFVVLSELFSVMFNWGLLFGLLVEVELFSFWFWGDFVCLFWFNFVRLFWDVIGLVNCDGGCLLFLRIFGVGFDFVFEIWKLIWVLFNMDFWLVVDWIVFLLNCFFRYLCNLGCFMRRFLIICMWLCFFEVLRIVFNVFNFEVDIGLEKWVLVWVMFLWI